MYILLDIIAVLLPIVAILLLILRAQSCEVKKREMIFKEALWARRHVLPLLLEEAECGGTDTCRTIVEIREKLQSQAYTLPEQVRLERELNGEIDSLFKEIKSSEKFKSNAVLLSLEKELGVRRNDMSKALNEYNFSIEKWKKLMRLPWFKIFSLAFEERKINPLEDV